MKASVSVKVINPAETIPPAGYRERKINAAETVPPVELRTRSATLRPGETISFDYVIDSRLEKQGRQADVYLARKQGNAYVVKVYRGGWRPDPAIREFLVGTQHPNLLGVLENGETGGCYYEICDYLPGGTLEDQPALLPDHIQRVIVPSVNEALHELHRNGILHCDLKPGNLFYNRGRTAVLIGDFGVSGRMGASGKLVGPVRGTPEYSPAVKTVGASAILTPAFDYGCFGYVLCRAALGHSLFEGMSMEEIAAARLKGVQIPSSVTGRLRSLITGLIAEDESIRWGYEEVRSWCAGEFVNKEARNAYVPSYRKKKPPVFIFGSFDGQVLTLTSLHQLAKAIREHWQQAVSHIRKRELVSFVRGLDESLTEKAQEAAGHPDPDVAVYRLLLLIEPDTDAIHFGGRVYPSLEAYAEALIGGKDDVAYRFLSSGLLLDYLTEAGYDPSQVNRLRQIIRRGGVNDRNKVVTIAFHLIGKKTAVVFGKTVGTIDELIAAMYGHSTAEIDALLDDHTFIAWMNRMGFEKEMHKMKERTGPK